MMPEEQTTNAASTAAGGSAGGADGGGSLRARLMRLSTTRANARAGLVADAGVSLALFALGVSRHGASAVLAAATVASGLLLFTLVEYVIHRWLFHGAAGTAEAGHRKHHDDPAGNDALPFFLPPLGMLALAALLMLVLQPATALFLAAAIAAGYAAYGISHTAMHRLRFRMPVLLRWAAYHHIHHHHPERNFGVTTPLWDYLLGTRYLRARQAAAAPQQGR